VISAAIIEMLPTEVRCSGAAIGFNICLGVFGATAPLIATYLVARTADDFAPVYYLMAVAFISLVALLGLLETASEPLLRGPRPCRRGAPGLRRMPEDDQPCRGGRAPKTALPTRTWVAPNCTAIS
jgi:hypothetical protein